MLALAGGFLAKGTTLRQAQTALPAGSDLAWLTDTASVISAADTYLLVTRMLGWDLDAYQAWLALTLTRLVTSGGQVLRSGIDLEDIQSPHRPACVSAETLRERLH